MIRRLLIWIGLLSPRTVPGAEARLGSMPTSVLPPSAVLARLDISLPADRSTAGTIRGRDPRGSTVLEAAPVFGASDPGFAARMGNPSQDPERPFGHVPTGTYLAVRRLLPRAPGEFGLHGALFLVPSLGQAARADARGRTSLLLHGGSTKAAVMGALRVPAATMARIVAMLPSDLAARNLEVVVDEVEETEEESFEDSWDDDELDHASWGWREQQGRDNDEYLRQMMLWDLMTQEEAARATSVEEEDIPAGAATPLSSAGAALPEPEEAKPEALKPEPWVASSAEAPISVAEAPVGTTSKDWSPSGGSYDR